MGEHHRKHSQLYRVRPGLLLSNPAAPVTCRNPCDKRIAVEIVPGRTTRGPSRLRFLVYERTPGAAGATGSSAGSAPGADFRPENLAAGTTGTAVGRRPAGSGPASTIPGAAPGTIATIRAAAATTTATTGAAKVGIARAATTTATTAPNLAVRVVDRNLMFSQECWPTRLTDARRTKARPARTARTTFANNASIVGEVESYSQGSSDTAAWLTLCAKGAVGHAASTCLRYSPGHDPRRSAAWRVLRELITAPGEIWNQTLSSGVATPQTSSKMSRRHRFQYRPRGINTTCASEQYTRMHRVRTAGRSVNSSVRKAMSPSASHRSRSTSSRRSRLPPSPRWFPSLPER